MESQHVQFDYVQSEGFGSVERLACTLANNGYRTIIVVEVTERINDAVNGILESEARNKHEIALESFPMVSVMILPNIGGLIRMTIKEP